jgi:thioredoxin 1
MEIFIMMEKQNKVSKNLFLSLFLLTAPLATTIVALHNQAHKNENSVLFLHELEHTRSAAQATLNNITKEGNVIVVFYEDWCPPCQRMTPIFQELASTLSTIRFIKVKRELYRSIFNFYGLSTVPAILFFRNGVLVKIQPSSLNKQDLVNLIKKIYH